MTPREEDAEDWFAKADEDLRAAHDLVRLGHIAVGAFHCQQAVEKALKGLQVRRQGRFERIHDLQRLCVLLSIKDARILESAEALSGYYTASRYPGAPGHVSAAEAADALLRAEEVVASCRMQR